jgi:hypothetical protein
MDATVYAIPGVVGGVAIVDSIIADAGTEPLTDWEYSQQYV